MSTDRRRKTLSNVKSSEKRVWPKSTDRGVLFVLISKSMYQKYMFSLEREITLKTDSYLESGVNGVPIDFLKREEKRASRKDQISTVIGV